MFDFTHDDADAIPSKGSVRKGKMTLNEAILKGVLSPEDIAYIKVATDPYHDTSVHAIQGIPDEYVGKSITEVFTLTKDISTPYGAGSGNWTCRIFNNPVLGTATGVRTAMNGNSYAQEVSNSLPGNINNVPLSTVNIDYSGNGQFQDYPGLNDYLTLEPEALNGEVKIIGMGIEVINTTAELQKQGMCTIARVPQMGSATKMVGRVYGNAGGTVGSFAVENLIPVISAPTRISELTTYPNYSQWEAREGAYVVLKQYNVASHVPTGFMGALRYLDHMSNGTSSGGIWGAAPCDTTRLTWETGTGMPVASYMQTQGYITAPMDSVCMMFTGLSEQTTLTLRCKIYVERRVNTSTTDLIAFVPLAKDSPPLNPKALELVSALWSNLPVAVKFGENPKGEWWQRVLGLIGDIGPVLLSLIPHPAAKLAAAALPVATRAFAGDSTELEVALLKKRAKKLKKKRKAEAANGWTARSGMHANQQKPLPKPPARKQLKAPPKK